MSFFVQNVRALEGFFKKHSPKGTGPLISVCALPIIGLVGMGLSARSQKTTILALATRFLLNFEMTRMKVVACVATSVSLAIFSTQDSLLGRISKSALRSFGFLFYFYGFGRALLLQISNKKIGAECFFAIGIGFFCTVRPFLAHVISSLFFKALILMGAKNGMIYESLADLFQKQGDSQKAFECYFLAYLATSYQVSKNRLDEKLRSLAVVLKDGSIEPHSYSKRAFEFLQFMKGEGLSDLSKVLFYLRRETMPLSLRELMEGKEKHLKSVIDIRDIWQRILNGDAEEAFIQNPQNHRLVTFLIAASLFQVSSNLRKSDEIPVQQRRALFLPFQVGIGVDYQVCLMRQQEHPLRQQVHFLCELIMLISKLSELLERRDCFRALPPYVGDLLKRELQPFLEDVLFARCKKAVELFLQEAGLSNNHLVELCVFLKNCSFPGMRSVLQRVVDKYFEKNKDHPECRLRGKELFLRCFPREETTGLPLFQAFYDPTSPLSSQEIIRGLSRRELLIFSKVALMISCQPDQQDSQVRRFIIS